MTEDETGGGGSEEERVTPNAEEGEAREPRAYRKWTKGFEPCD